MKRFLSLLLSVLFVSVLSAQVKTVCSASGVKVAFKEAFMQGSTVTIRFTLTNNTGKDLKPYLEGREGTRFDVQEVEAYDDEGNCYDLKSGTMSVGIGNARISSRYDGAFFSLPDEITVKGIISIKKVDGNAKSFRRIAFPLRYLDLNDEAYARGYVMLKNVPVPREE